MSLAFLLKKRAIKNMSLAFLLKKEVYCICEAKIDRMIYKIKDPEIKEKYQELFEMAKKVFSNKIDYVNWFFDRVTIIPDGKSPFPTHSFFYLFSSLGDIGKYRRILKAMFSIESVDKYANMNISYFSQVVSDDIAYTVLSFFNSPQKMCEELENKIAKKDDTSISLGDYLVRTYLPMLQDGTISFKYRGNIEEIYEWLRGFKRYYSLGIGRIDRYSVVKIKSPFIADLFDIFEKIKREYEDEKGRLIHVSNRDLKKEEKNLLLVCSSNPNFEWYRVEKGDELERKSLDDCCNNSHSHEIWTLREKKFDESGELEGHISRIHAGFNKSERALKEIVGYGNNKPSPRYFKCFADLAKSGLFDKIFLEGEYIRAENLVWEDLPESMLEDIVTNNKRLLEFDKYLTYKFTGKTLPEITYYRNGNKKREVWKKYDGRLFREDGPANIDYWDNGNEKKVVWVNSDGNVERDDGPAIIDYFVDGKIEKEEWYKNGKLNREDGPAEIKYYENENKKMEVWYENGGWYREDGGPVFILYYASGNVEQKRWDGKRKDGPNRTEYYENGNIKKEIWSEDGICHRKDGPAYIEYYENGDVNLEGWYENGLCGRKDGPAEIGYYEDGNISFECWYSIGDGSISREDGPAWIEYYKNGIISAEKWYKNGQKHREDGPAYITYSEDGNIEREVWYKKGIREESIV